MSFTKCFFFFGFIILVTGCSNNPNSEAPAMGMTLKPEIVASRGQAPESVGFKSVDVQIGVNTFAQYRLMNQLNPDATITYFFAEANRDNHPMARIDIGITERLSLRLSGIETFAAGVSYQLVGKSLADADKGNFSVMLTASSGRTSYERDSKPADDFSLFFTDVALPTFSIVPPYYSSSYNYEYTDYGIVTGYRINKKVLPYVGAFQVRADLTTQTKYFWSSGVSGAKIKIDDELSGMNIGARFELGQGAYAMGEWQTYTLDTEWGPDLKDHSFTLFIGVRI